MIEAQDLTFTYPGAPAPTLTGLSFGVEKGEIFGFLGPSGAGKSTTQKILIGLLKDFDGGVSVFGRNIQSWKSDFYENVGVSFELPNHYLKLTAIENLSYFRSLYQGETEEPRKLLELVGLGADRWQAGFTVLQRNEEPPQLRAIPAQQAGIDLSDEPTTGLDPVNSRRIKDIILNKKREGRTVFLTTHDMVAATELCDRVAFLVDGEIKLIGSPRSLMLTHGNPHVRVEYRAGDRIDQRQFPLEDLGHNQAFLDLLRTNAVETIHTEEATLEKVFIDVTGRALS